MKSFQKPFQEWWMSMDIKPKGKAKQLVSRLARRIIQRETKKEFKQHGDDRDVRSF